jgi:O-acetyl-ADP-ribose deacetylase (regulator of RNase III)
LIRKQKFIYSLSINIRLYEKIGGVAGAIENRCGFQVQKDCDEYLRRVGVQCIAVSQLTHTKAYNIPAKYILHACGPCWHDYKTHEKPTCYLDLKNTFFNVLIYLETTLTDVESVAMPLISSGLITS